MKKIVILPFKNGGFWVNFIKLLKIPNYMVDWQIISLETEPTACVIGDYFEAIFKDKIMRIKANINMYYKKTSIDMLIKSIVKSTETRKLILGCSGYFHHYTYGLCRHADNHSQNYGYFHFDHHNDFWSYMPKRKEIHCGGFVDQILQDTNASAAFFVGTKVMTWPKGKIFPRYLPNISEEELRSKGGFIRKSGTNLLEERISHLPHDAYLSFDLDVLSKSEMFSDFNQGDMGEQDLLSALNIIKRNKQIIGADIFGYAGKDIKSKSLRVYEHIVNSLLEA